MNINNMPGDTAANTATAWRVCVAPMMKYTDRHYRYFARLMSRHTRLYTEMVVASAIIRGDRERFLTHHPNESPVALQLGGSDPKELAEAAAIGVDYGYDEINLNVGCPSSRVQSGNFGACLMAAPQVVAECVAAISHAVKVPVTVKTRVGIDDHDDYEFLSEFTRQIITAGVDALMIHARKAWLSGLSPRQNRSLPELKYENVYALKREFSHLPIVINGGIESIDACQQHLQYCDGVMLGRVACRQPYLLAATDSLLLTDSIDDSANDTTPLLTREDLFVEYLAYMDQHWGDPGQRQKLVKPLFGMYLGQPGAKKWRQRLNAMLQQGDLGIGRAA